LEITLFGQQLRPLMTLRLPGLAWLSPVAVGRSMLQVFGYLKNNYTNKFEK
jgi:hypothetical protein